MILKGIPAPLRLSLDHKLKEVEDIAEAKIKAKVAETIAKLKDIVNQKMVLIRTLKNPMIENNNDDAQLWQNV